MSICYPMEVIVQTIPFPIFPEDGWLLEDGSGFWSLEETASEFWLLEEA